MLKTRLQRAWQAQNSLVCVGLDPELTRIPPHIASSEQPFFTFAKAIVDATAPHVCAYKPQFAHFAAAGRTDELRDLCHYIKRAYPDHVLILDAKRGDIGSTAAFYAIEAYEYYQADAVTVNPYLGQESLTPYLTYADKGIVVLCRTSNPDSDWLQGVGTPPVFERVADGASALNGQGQVMLVTGATYPEELGQIRSRVGDMPLLVPGIGAQGGDLNAVLEHGLDAAGQGLAISSSRAIIYAGDGEDFAQLAAEAAESLKDSINKFRNAK